ncbi:hypothetical protein ABID21_005012 [Pseudorhizobium tarimense]|uniref:Uncharacterized protein n=1 Tax=Pseudorhizobium tarimense TaxID=1079109 RepID=A0ABV2HEN3_9HYPH|nr:hypothetical protein [Pseudorhizobium tarimense]MCJ8521838.1 hypothetical protein [Pseudorhizobium tarimense]
MVKRNRAAFGGSKKTRAKQLRGLIAKLDYLIARSIGLKHFSYKVRRHQAEMALKGVNRSMKPKRPKNGRTPYVVCWGVLQEAAVKAFKSVKATAEADLGVQ